MGKVQYYTATSFNGFIADEDNSLGWLFEADKGPEQPFKPFFASVGAFVMGATTYRWIVDNDEAGSWSTNYGDVPAWVFTHRSPNPVPGANLTFVQGDVRPVHEAMAAACTPERPNIWLVGGGELAGTFADAGLLDEIILGVAPVALGGGAPLLPRRLTSSRVALASVGRVGEFAYLTYTVS